MQDPHLGRLIHRKTNEYGDLIAVRYKEGDAWQELTYRAFGGKIDALARSLIAYGVNEGDMVGIFSENRPEWAITDFATLSVRAVSVPIYATNTAQQAEYIVSDARLGIVFVGDQNQYDKIKSFSGAHEHLRYIVAFDSTVKLRDDDSLYFSDLLKRGGDDSYKEIMEQRLNAGSPDDVATIIYTSGTTGDPKGVMLTHANFCHQIDAVDANFNVGPKDRSLCFLPLSHAYERAWSYVVFENGAQNNYLADPKRIIEYMQDVRPTAMVSVPRLYEKIYSTVFDRLEKASPFRKKLFKWAVVIGSDYGYAVRNNEAGVVLSAKHWLADRLVLGKIRDIVGGPKNFFSAGGAALSKDIEEFFFAAGLLVCEGYGLTESSPMITYNCPSAFKFGTVGKPVPLCEVKIGENGEILARGPNIMKGYYNKPEDTAATIVDGWLKTGDVGIIDEDGFVKITDRIKDLIITSGGKNIAPQRIETLVGRDHYIEQIEAIGDGRKYVSALIVPAFAALETYARDQGIAFASREELVQKQEIIDFYRKRIEDQSGELAGYEKIKAFTLLPNEFTQEGGELTPTMKIKRKVVVEKYRDIIDAMYAHD